MGWHYLLSCIQIVLLIVLVVTIEDNMSGRNGVRYRLAEIEKVLEKIEINTRR